MMLRRIRSFVRRDSRITEAQREAMELHMPTFGLQLSSGKVNFSEIFQREAKRILEIGFGSGASLLAKAKENEAEDFVGIETHQPGVGALLLGMQKENVKNIRIFNADAVDVFKQCIPDESLDVVQIFFPDPWPKRRHHKRRLIQSSFVNLIAEKLKPGGLLHLATDWEDYAKEMMRVISAANQFENSAGEMQYANRSSQRPIVTKFEQRGKMSGREIWELQFCKKPSGQ